MSSQPAGHDDYPQWDLPAIVKQLRNSREIEHKVRYLGRIRELPSRDMLRTILDGLAVALFPTHYGRCVLNDESIDFFVGNTLNTAMNQLWEQIRRALYFSLPPASHDDADIRHLAAEMARRFASQLPDLRALLVSDLHAAYQGDPAATSLSEILLSYPGFQAIMHHRFAHALHRLGVPFLARLIAELAHSDTGIDIHPGATIAGSFFIDHGTGVVIGETCIIGERVRLYQAVTLGAKSFPADEHGNLTKGIPRHPIVEDDVVIYAGATVLGRITIGRGSTVGGNVWLTHSVEPNSYVSQARARSDQ